ncbi:predicted protein [Streptomyces viridochromogenes DSM 40736]|uniref:Predicted protein n=1 Tax=Streptomyces viridochromogenes (strain DSM 40736 / JCM 4977 / BCRC 1201 / Tue 494) TaxID=591159 RepID=D9XGN7_STRVT|nr:predicted protein [Streptomyces viridochromogenes DSM 40736]
MGAGGGGGPGSGLRTRFRCHCAHITTRCRTCAGRGGALKHRCMFSTKFRSKCSRRVEGRPHEVIGTKRSSAAGRRPGGRHRGCLEPRAAPDSGGLHRRGHEDLAARQALR